MLGASNLTYSEATSTQKLPDCTQAANGSMMLGEAARTGWVANGLSVHCSVSNRVGT
jgi:hypothetical protein